MISKEEKHARLVRELLEYFNEQRFQTIAARNIEGYAEPEAIHNEGFGDQEDKRPDILAYDGVEKCFLLGIVRTGEKDFESEESLTEYNVFLDQVDERYNKPYRLFIIAPSNKISQLTSLITHYIHREYWHRIIFVSSRVFEE